MCPSVLVPGAGRQKTLCCTRSSALSRQLYDRDIDPPNMSRPGGSGPPEEYGRLCVPKAGRIRRGPRRRYLRHIALFNVPARIRARRLIVRRRENEAVASILEVVRPTDIEGVLRVLSDVDRNPQVLAGAPTCFCSIGVERDPISPSLMSRVSVASARSSRKAADRVSAPRSVLPTSSDR